MEKAIHPKRIQRTSRPLDRDQIARLAYSYWEARQGQPGSAEDDWVRAEQELARRQTPADAPSTSRTAGAAGRSSSSQASRSN